MSKRQSVLQQVWASQTDTLGSKKFFTRTAPAARTMGLPWVNWRCLRTSHAVWLKLAGADVKDAQGQMRHSRASTTLDIYQQFVPESQQRVVAKLSSLSRLVN